MSGQESGNGSRFAATLFVGLRPPPVLAERARSWQRSLGHEITAPHVTLKAPGRLSAPQILACREACRHAAPFQVRIGGVGSFGERVIFLRAEGPNLTALHCALVAAVGQEPGGFELDGYHPHLTLAVNWRPMRPGLGHGWAEVLASAEAEFADLEHAPLDFTAREVVLYRKDAPGQPYVEDRVWTLKG